MGSQALTILGQRALGYAAAGVPVFPCVPGGKVPLTPNGFHDATTDPAVITAWWTRHQQANVAAPTGAPAFDVLDVDVRPTGSGWDALHEARAAGLVEGWVRAVQTPSGGLHLHYPGSDQRNGTIRGRHLDFRGQGGYVLLHPRGGRPRPTPASTSPSTSDRGDGRWTGPRSSHCSTPRPRRWATRDGPAPRAAQGTRPGGSPSMSPANRRATATTPCSGPPTAPSRRDVADFEPLIGAAVAAGLPEAEARRTVTSARAAAIGQSTPPRPASSVHRDPAPVVGR